jgi:hypothetical protein
MAGCIRAYRPGKKDRFAILHEPDNGCVIITNGHWVVTEYGPKPDQVRKLVRRIRSIGAELDLRVDGDCGIGMGSPPSLETMGASLSPWWTGHAPIEIPHTFEIIRSGATVVAALEAERPGSVGLHVRLDYLEMFGELGATAYSWTRPKPGQPATMVWFLGGSTLSEPVGCLMPTRI